MSKRYLRLHSLTTFISRNFKPRSLSKVYKTQWAAHHQTVLSIMKVLTPDIVLLSHYMERFCRHLKDQERDHEVACHPIRLVKLQYAWTDVTHKERKFIGENITHRLRYEHKLVSLDHPTNSGVFLIFHLESKIKLKGILKTSDFTLSSWSLHIRNFGLLIQPKWRKILTS